MKIRALLIFLIISSLFPVRVQAGVDVISKMASDEVHFRNQSAYGERERKLFLKNNKL